MSTSLHPFFRLEVSTRPRFASTRAQALARAIAALGIHGVTSLRVCDLYFLQGDLDATTLDRLAQVVLCDPVTEQARLTPLADGQGAPPDGQYIIEVALHPGVTDSVAESLLDAARLLDIRGLRHAATGQQVILEGALTPHEVQRIAQGLLANSTIQFYTINQPLTPVFASASADDTVEMVPLCAADAPALLEISRTRRLALDLVEMQAIQAYFRQAAREPTDVELEMLAQT